MPAIYSFILFLETQKTASDATLMKESKLIPNMIFMLEKYDVAMARLASA